MFLSNNKHTKGFTLLEILVALCITSIVMVIAAKTFLTQQKSYDIQGQVTEMVQTARAAMDLMTREIRMAGYDPTDSDFDGIVPDSDRFQVFSDLNGDGDTDDADEAITYIYDSAQRQITRDTGSGAYLLAEHIQSFGFECFESNGITTTTENDIRQMQIIMTLRTQESDPDYASNSGYRTYTLTSMITPKNLDYW